MTLQGRIARIQGRHRPTDSSEAFDPSMLPSAMDLSKYGLDPNILSKVGITLPGGAAGGVTGGAGGGWGSAITGAVAAGGALLNFKGAEKAAKATKKAAQFDAAARLAEAQGETEQAKAIVHVADMHRAEAQGWGRTIVISIVAVGGLVLGGVGLYLWQKNKKKTRL